MKKFDVVALGEILIDMTFTGKSESGQTLFEQNPGGAPANVLSAVKRLGKIISYDPNWCAPLWKSEEEGKKEMCLIIPYVDIIKISDEETKLLTDFESGEDASAALIEQGIKTVIVTMGEKGALVRTKDGFVTCSAQNVKAVDTTGAGDAFMCSFLWNVAKCGKSEISLKEAEKFTPFQIKLLHGA